MKKFDISKNKLNRSLKFALKCLTKQSKVNLTEAYNTKKIKEQIF